MICPTLPVTIKDPFTGAPFPGNRIPASRIAPLAQRILDLFPLPTRPGRAGNYLAQPVSAGPKINLT